jgi:hypothetical protein
MSEDVTERIQRMKDCNAELMMTIEALCVKQERLQKEHAELLYALKVIASHWPHWASQMNVKQIDLDAIALVRSAIAKGTPDAQA